MSDQDTPLEKLERALSAERTAREMAERERDEARNTLATEQSQIVTITGWDILSGKTVVDYVAEAVRERDTLRAKLAALESQTPPSVSEAVQEIRSMLFDRSHILDAYDIKAIESILSRLRTQLEAALADTKRLRHMLFSVLHQRTSILGLKVEDDLLRENEPLLLEVLAAMQPAPDASPATEVRG